jgi:hypothetical protein
LVFCRFYYSLRKRKYAGTLLRVEYWVANVWDLNPSEDVGSSVTRALLLLSRLNAFKKVPYDDVTGVCR